MFGPQKKSLVFNKHGSEMNGNRGIACTIDLT